MKKSEELKNFLSNSFFAYRGILNQLSGIATLISKEISEILSSISIFFISFSLFYFVVAKPFNFLK